MPITHCSAESNFNLKTVSLSDRFVPIEKSQNNLLVKHSNYPLLRAKVPLADRTMPRLTLPQTSHALFTIPQKVSRSINSILISYMLCLEYDHAKKDSTQVFITERIASSLK